MQLIFPISENAEMSWLRFFAQFQKPPNCCLALPQTKKKNNILRNGPNQNPSVRFRRRGYGFQNAQPSKPRRNRFSRRRPWLIEQRANGELLVKDSFDLLSLNNLIAPSPHEYETMSTFPPTNGFNKTLSQTTPEKWNSAYKSSNLE